MIEVATASAEALDNGVQTWTSNNSWAKRTLFWLCFEDTLTAWGVTMTTITLCNCNGRVKSGGKNHLQNPLNHHESTMKSWKQPMKDDNQQIYQVCYYSITIIKLTNSITGIKKVPSCTGQCHFHWRSPGKVGTFQVVIFQNTAQGVEFTWRRLGGSSFFRYFFFENVCFLRKLSGWIPRKWTGNGWGGLRV